MWALADAANWYMVYLQFYTGRQGNGVKRGLGPNIVKTLTKLYLNSFHHVFFDNYFTGIDPLLVLKKSNLCSFGTIWVNRKGSSAELKPMVKKGMKDIGESETVQHNNITTSVWQDNQPVTVAPMNSDPAEEA